MSTEHLRRSIDVCISARDWESSDGDLQIALLHAVERDTRSRWRVVCANILVECSEPYRTLVLRREVLENLQAQQRLLSDQCRQEPDSTPCSEIFQVEAELHMPLGEDTQAEIM